MMRKIIQVSDSFRLKQGNLIIIGNYDKHNINSKSEVLSEIGDTIKIIKPSGQELVIRVISKDISISLVGHVNLAMELPAEVSEDNVPIGSIVYG